jgi:hypothetical protein
MAVRIAPLEADAVACVARNMRARDREEIFATRWDDDADAVARETVALARLGCVAWNGDAPVAVASAIPLWPGVWSIGLYATDAWPRVARAVTRWIARTTPALIAAGGHRAECRSLASHATAHRWLERLGAVREAVLPDCGRNRETFYLYAWTHRPAGETPMCFGPSPPPPPPPPLPTPENTPDIQTAAAAERERLRRARGRAATILTGGLGDTSAAPAAVKRLLGE